MFKKSPCTMHTGALYIYIKKKQGRLTSYRAKGDGREKVPVASFFPPPRSFYMSLGTSTRQSRIMVKEKIYHLPDTPPYINV